VADASARALDAGAHIGFARRFDLQRPDLLLDDESAWLA